jgi:hypothetical protein
LIIGLTVMMFSCAEDLSDIDYKWADAGLNINQSLTFSANAGTQTIKFPATPPKNSLWNIRKSEKSDWIEVSRYDDSLVISAALYDGLTDDTVKDRKGSVILVKEGEDGTIVEAGTINVTQTCAIPGSDKWDSDPVTPYKWDYNGNDTVPVNFPASKQTEWGSKSIIVVDGEDTEVYNYVYKIIGKNASYFAQTEVDDIRPNREIKLAAIEKNEERDTLSAWLIVTDRGNKTIHLRRELRIAARALEFIFDKDEIVVSHDATVVEVEAISFNKKNDSIVCKLVEVDSESYESNDYDWVKVISDWTVINDEEGKPIKGRGKFTIAVSPNSDWVDAREAKLELVNNKTGASFDPPVYLSIIQNQKPKYKQTN